MALTNKRIIDLPERATLNDDDYVAIDGDTGGTAKHNLADVVAEVADNSTELTGIREGADGKTYQSAGDAVRGQISALKDSVGGQITDLKEDLNVTQGLTIDSNGNAFSWESGGIDGLGHDVANSARARMKNSVPCKYYKSVETDTTLEMVVAIYDASGTYLGYYNGSTLSTGGIWLQYIDLSDMSENNVRIITRLKATPLSAITPAICNELVKFNSVIVSNLSDIESVQSYLFDGFVPTKTEFTTINYYISNGYQMLSGSETNHTEMFYGHAGEKHVITVSGDGKPYLGSLLIGRNASGPIQNYTIIAVDKNIINIDDNSTTLIINCSHDGYYYIYWGSNTTVSDSDDLILANGGITSESAEYITKANTRMSASRGGFHIDNGRNNLASESGNNARARTEFLPVKSGDLITSPLYPFIVTVFTSDGIYSFNTWDNVASRWTNEYTCTSDGYVRLLFKRYDNGNITDVDLKRIKDSVSITDYATQNIISSIVNDAIVRANDGFYTLQKKLGSNNVNKDNYLARGKITKSGTKILDSNGAEIVLTGIGTHNVWEYQNLYTPEVFKTLVLNGINCIRLSVYLKDYRYADSQLRKGYGYVDHPSEIKSILDKVIPMATSEGLYIILDWHSYVPSDGSALQYTTEQTEFFTYFSTKYASYNNILYEIQNEPYNDSASDLLASTQSCASIIRGNNADAILICGHGSDGIETINTLFNVTHGLNTFISPHLYTGSSTVDNAIKPYVDLGIPIFVTEWGNSSSSGADNPNDSEAIKMFNYCHTNGISYCVWKMTYQSMDTAILVYNPDRALYGYGFGGWHDGDLSHNGHMYFENIWNYHFGS